MKIKPRQLHRHQLIFVINDRRDDPTIDFKLPSSRSIVPQQRPFFFSHGFQFDDLQVGALTMKPCNVEEEEGSLLFPVPFDVHVEIVISSCTVCSLFFTLWLTIRRTLPSAVAEYAIAKKKRNLFFVKNPVMVDPSWSRRGKYFRHSSHHRPQPLLIFVSIRSRCMALSSSIQMITTRCFSTPRRR